MSDYICDCDICRLPIFRGSNYKEIGASVQHVDLYICAAGLRQLADSQNMAASHALSLKVENAKMQQRIAELEAGIRDFLAGNYPNPRDHRPNECEHGANYWEDCYQCDAAHLKKVLGKP